MCPHFRARGNILHEGPRRFNESLSLSRHWRLTAGRRRGNDGGSRLSGRERTIPCSSRPSSSAPTPS
ncbi:MAG: hypothetical protein MZV64_18065 [Ignavibacteriales bacterium]|nr:hypothetical protein [Ignavibacteriales bacterium]